MIGLHESTAVVKAHAPIGATANTWYNGATSTSSTNGIDCLGYHEMLLALSLGVMGSSGTVNVYLFHSNTNLASSAVQATDAAGNNLVFSQKVQGTDDGKTFVGRVRVNNLHRYVWAKVVVGTATTPLHVFVLLSRAKVDPVSQEQTVEFNA